MLLVLLLPALACNLPVGPRPKSTPGVNFPTGQPGQPFITPLPPGPAVPTNLPPAIGQPYTYLAQPGDTLPAVAAHFGVDATQVQSGQPLPADGLLTPGQPLTIASPLPPSAYPGPLFPDGEVVYGPDAAGFDIQAFVADQGGYLSSYTEQVGTEKLSGAEIIRRVALESSTNPRLLLALLEYTSGWVKGQPKNQQTLTYPFGFYVPQYQGLSKELSLTVRMLSQGYYGWRDGSLTELEFLGNQKVRLSPQLNAGTVAVQYLFTKLLERKSWENALYGPAGFPQTYAALFGDPWARAEQTGPLFPAGIQQPDLELPFAPGEHWSLTGGPHLSWGVGSPFGAIDLAPVTGEPTCVVSTAWVLASAPGVVVRSERDELALDLDGDGSETTGWVLFYYHLANQDRAPLGTRVNLDSRLGHPSCEGGRATGTHFHIARKFNGEWLPASAPLPFVLSGWTVHPTKIQYEGTMTKGDQVVTARPDGEHDSILVR